MKIMEHLMKKGGLKNLMLAVQIKSAIGNKCNLPKKFV